MWFKKLLLHLNDGKQDPVQQKPDQDVHQIEDKRIPAEEEPDGPRCTGSYYDALRQRLQQNGIRHHGYTQFRPPTKHRDSLIHDAQRNTSSAHANAGLRFINFKCASNNTDLRLGDTYRSTSVTCKFK